MAKMGERGESDTVDAQRLDVCKTAMDEGVCARTWEAGRARLALPLGGDEVRATDDPQVLDIRELL